jgi:hypothetical protein
MAVPYNPPRRFPPRPQPANQAPSPATEKLLEARNTCRDLMALLAEENAGLLHADMAALEARLLHKKRLTLRLEQLLSDVKSGHESWRQDYAARAQAIKLEEEFRLFQDLARSNAQLLKAAHAVRADLVKAIRDTMDAETPKARLYGANGAVHSVDGHTRLVMRDV